MAMTPGPQVKSTRLRAGKCHTYFRGRSSYNYAGHLADLIAPLRNNTGAQESFPRPRAVKSDLPLVRYAKELELEKQEEQGVETKVYDGKATGLAGCALSLNLLP